MVLIFSWFSIGTFYLAFNFLTEGVVSSPARDPFGGYGAVAFLALKQFYLFSIIMIFIASLGNRPQASKMLYTGSYLLFAIIMLFMMYIVRITNSSLAVKYSLPLKQQFQLPLLQVNSILQNSWKCL